MFNILVAEDDADLLKLYCKVISKDGYNPIPARDGAEALDIIDKEFIDLIVCDIMMPRIDGVELTKQLRECNYNVPILVITAKGMFSDKMSAFSAGADDYMVKPIDTKEMLLRIAALLRRARITSERNLVIGDCRLDYDSLTATYNGEIISMPQKEFQILFKLLSDPNHIFTRQTLMDEFWGFDTETDSRTVDVHINRIREKFKDVEAFEIVTVRGLGYKAVKK